MACYEDAWEDASSDYQGCRYKSSESETCWVGVGTCYGGESGIRTHDTVARMPVFETGAFVHSAISPWDEAVPGGINRCTN